MQLKLRDGSHRLQRSCELSTALDLSFAQSLLQRRVPFALYASSLGRTGVSLHRLGLLLHALFASSLGLALLLGLRLLLLAHLLLLPG